MQCEERQYEAGEKYNVYPYTKYFFRHVSGG